MVLRYGDPYYCCVDDAQAIYLDKDVFRRLDHARGLGRAVVDDSAEVVKKLGVLARGVMSDDALTVTFEAVVPEGVSLDMGNWALDLGLFLFDARSTLDNLMWSVARDHATEPLTLVEKKNLYFPVAV